MTNVHLPDCPCRNAATVSRRNFIGTAGVAAVAAIAGLSVRGKPPEDESPSFVPFPGVPIVDGHQHSLFSGRPDKNLLLHQRNTGIRLTVLLPSGVPGSPPGWNVSAGNEYVEAFARDHADRFVHFASVNTARWPGDMTAVLETYLKRGALGIGELKNRVECDSPGVIRAAEVAREYDVAMLLHFQDDTAKDGPGFNVGYARFHRIIERFPTVKFIAHAQTFWAHVDKNYTGEKGLYPRGPVAAGGLTDRWLSDYPNFYGDLSAGSGNNALSRDTEFSQAFLIRHQDKLIYGSDCGCLTGVGPACVAAVKQRLLKQLCPTDEIRNKLLYGNIRKLIRLGAAHSV